MRRRGLGGEEVPHFSATLACALREAVGNLRTHGVFAAGARLRGWSTGGSARVDGVFQSSLPRHPWDIYGDSETATRATYSAEHFAVTDSPARFARVFRSVFFGPDGEGSKGGEEEPSGDETRAALVESVRATVAAAAGGTPQPTLALKPYLLSKVPGVNMKWHVDVDARGEATAEADLVCYVVLGPPGAVNCVVVFAYDTPEERAALNALDEQTIALATRDLVPPEERYDARGRLRLVPLAWPAELRSATGGSCRAGGGMRAYGVWVTLGDLLVFDGSVLHGVYNRAAQRVLAFNASTTGLVVPRALSRPSATRKRTRHGLGATLGEEAPPSPRLFR